MVTVVTSGQLEALGPLDCDGKHEIQDNLVRKGPGKDKDGSREKLYPNDRNSPASASENRLNRHQKEF